MAADRSSSDPEPPGSAPRRSLPLRGTDVVEAATTVLLAVLGIVGLLAAVLVGDDMHERALSTAWPQAARHDQAGRPERPGSRALLDQGDHLSAPAPADRSSAGGGDRRGITEVTLVEPRPRSTPDAGERGGEGVVGPRRSSSALALAFWWVVVAFAGVLFVLWLAWLVVTRATAAHNSHRWARDWAAVEPVWSGRIPRRPGEPTDRP